MLPLCPGRRCASCPGLGNAHSLSVKACSTWVPLAGLGCCQLDEHEQSAGTLDQSPHSAGVALAFDKWSPSQWPRNCRSSTSGGRTWMLSMSGIWSRLSWPGLCCVACVYNGPAASWRPVHWAIRPTVERRCSCRWFLVTRAAYVLCDTGEPASGRFALATSLSTVKCAPSQTRRTVDAVYGQDRFDSGAGGSFAGH